MLRAWVGQRSGGGSNTSTVAMGVERNDEKGAHCLVVQLGQLVPGDVNTGTWHLRLAQSQLRDSEIKVMNPAVLRPENDFAGGAQQQL
jgi:hypothetical protein